MSFADRGAAIAARDNRPSTRLVSPTTRAFVDVIAWVGVYVAVVCAPLFALLLGPRPPGLGFWWDLSMALGFAGLAMMGVQFLLTARFKRATAPFGIDVIYYFHRYVGVVAVLVILAHPGIAIADNPAVAGWLDPRDAPLHMTAGVASVVALLLVAVTSVARRPLRISYEHWRLTHTALSVSAVGLAFVDVFGVGYYVATPPEQGLWVAIGLSLAAVVVYVRGIRPWQLWRRPYRVTGVTPERGSSWTVSVEPDGHAGFPFQPGQFAWLSLGHGPFSMREHPFSMSSSPSLPSGRLEFTIKALGDFTRTVGDIRTGARAYVDGPYGAFSIDRHPAPGYVFIAGGIGIAPMLAMLKALADRQDRRPLTLFYAYSQWDRMTCRDVVEALRQRLSLTVVPVLDEPPQDWTGERGWIAREVLARHLPPDFRDLAFFVCGPEAMTQAMERLLRDLGVPMAKVHSELFEMV